MRRILWTVAPVAMGAALALGASPAQAAPTANGLPELLLPAPAPLHRSSAQVEPRRGATKLDLGDYNVPGQRADQPADSSAPARA
jgi:hypothetical protein